MLLALAGIKPDDDWKFAIAPLLPTVDIMHFIREHYGKDYKPNSRETIRRQTLHQFEQARLVDRNRDKPSRATNSKNNNYSLNQPIIEILKLYPLGGWQTKITEYQDKLIDLTAVYAKELNKKAAPLKTNETDMVSVEVRGIISTKENPKILWANKLEIVEIISISTAEETENILKLGTE